LSDVRIAKAAPTGQNLAFPILPARECKQMAETIQVGSKVPDFSLDTYNPKTGDFDQVSLEKNMKAGKWTLLFFYPADFTFV
jgi:hypothetical protein